MSKFPCPPSWILCNRAEAVCRISCPHSWLRLLTGGDDREACLAAASPARRHKPLPATNELESAIRGGSPSEETVSRVGSPCELYTAEDKPLEIPCSDGTGAAWCTSRYFAPVGAPYHLIELAGCYFSVMGATHSHTHTHVLTSRRRLYNDSASLHLGLQHHSHTSYDYKYLLVLYSNQPALEPRQVIHVTMPAIVK
jgi:hypothetical protein